MKCVVQQKGLQPPEDRSGTPAEPYVSSVTVLCVLLWVGIKVTLELFLLLHSLALSGFAYNASVILLTHMVVFCVLRTKAPFHGKVGC